MPTLVAPSFQTGFLWKQLDLLDRAFEPRPFDPTFAVTIVLATVAGYALWRLSNGSLLAGALATMPPSKRSPSFDPLLVLELWEKEFQDARQGREDEETLQSLVSTPYQNRSHSRENPADQRGPAPTAPAKQAHQDTVRSVGQAPPPAGT